MVRERVAAALTEARQAIETELSGLQSAAADLDEGQRLAEARHQLQGAGSALERRFQAAFDKVFEERTAAPSREGVYQEETLGFPELALVDDEQLSDALTLRNLARRLRSSVDAELEALQPRVAFMLGATDLAPDRDPLAPDAICEALSAACARLDGPRPVKALLLEMLVGRLGTDLAPLYHEVNAFLVAHEVLPRVRRSAARNPGRAPAAGQGRDAADPGGPSDIIRQLLGARDGAAPGAALRAAPAPGADAELLRLLTRLQRGEPGGALGEDAFTIAADAATTNVLHHLVDAGLGRHLNPVDGIVIDVVATLFDHIFEDDRVPDAMKGLIGRLQIPVLKLALKDHSFFSNRQHPARRLINTLAQAASTWDDNFAADGPLYHIADFLIHRIQDEFHDDGAIFALCLGELETFLADQDRRVDKRAAAVTTQLEQRERRDIATAAARNATAAHLANPALPPAVRGFIDDMWSKVLHHAAVVGGDEGEQWRRAVALMDELVWSVLPKRGRDERQRLIQTLPTLLAGLRKGLDTVGTAQAARDTFFAALVKLHAAAVKAGMAEGDTTEDEAAAPASACGAAPAVAAEPSAPELDRLERGTSVELKDESGAVRRVRLTWISPARTLYLFANRQGQRALALTRQELARRFATGAACLADEQPLLDRLVDNVLDRYQPEARRA